MQTSEIMTVGRLKKILDQYPDEMHVIHDFHSDHAPLPEPTVEETIYNPDNAYYEKFYGPQWQEHQKPLLTKALHFAGN